MKIENLPDLPDMFLKQSSRYVKLIPVKYGSSYIRNEFNEYINCYDIELKNVKEDKIIVRTFIYDNEWKSKSNDVFMSVLDVKDDIFSNNKRSLLANMYLTDKAIAEQKEKYSKFLEEYGEEYPELYL